MTNPEPLQNPPIQEAIFDVRIAPVNIANWESALRSQFEREYPTFQYFRQFQASLSLGPDPQPSPERHDLGLLGYVLKTSDGTRVAQFRRDGFALNILPRYPGWDAIAPITARMWSAYLELAKPRSILRISLRYLNRLTFSLTSDFDFDKYLTSAPRIPDPLPQTFGQFLSRVVVPIDNDERGVALTQFTQEDPTGKSAVIVIDVEAFRTTLLRSDTDSVSAEFARLRQIKNNAFFGALTKAALEQYK